MMVGFLAEPALLIVIFVASLISQSTALPVIAERLATESFALYPSLAFTAVAFALVLLAENARLPVDNPATHLELTMIHEAMLLEYSARHLALMEWSAALKLFNYACIGIALFLPWGEATGATPTAAALLAAVPILALKLAAGGAVLAVAETVFAKLRVFRVPELLATAFLLAVSACSSICCSKLSPGTLSLDPNTERDRRVVPAARVRHALAAHCDAREAATVQARCCVQPRSCSPIARATHLYLSALLTLALRSCSSPGCCTG
jgi:hypothetical protein